MRHQPSERPAGESDLDGVRVFYDTVAEAYARLLPDTAPSRGALAVSLPTNLITGLENAPASVVNAPDPAHELLERTHLITR